MPFGSGLIGGDTFGGDDTPLGAPVELRNSDMVRAVDGVFQLASDLDDFGPVYFEARIVDENMAPIHPGTFFQRTQGSPIWNKPSILPLTRTRAEDLIDDVAIFRPGLQMTPNRKHFLIVRATTDSNAAPFPSTANWTSWWNLVFMPTMTGWEGEISNLRVYDSVMMDTIIQPGAKCRNIAPFVAWDCNHQYDVFRWGIGRRKEDAAMPYRTKDKSISFQAKPLHTGVWYLKIAPVWGGVTGKIETVVLNVEGMEILVGKRR